jgi:hypothetical protein
VTDGRTALGTVEQVSGAFVAIDTSGVEIGRFRTAREAARTFDRERA